MKASKKPIWGLLLPETRDDLPGSKSVIRLVKTCYKDFACCLGFGENWIKLKFSTDWGTVRRRCSRSSELVSQLNLGLGIARWSHEGIWSIWQPQKKFILEWLLLFDYLSIRQRSKDLKQIRPILHIQTKRLNSIQIKCVYLVSNYWIVHKVVIKNKRLGRHVVIDANYSFNSLEIRLQSKDLKHLISGNGLPELQG